MCYSSVSIFILEEYVNESNNNMNSKHFKSEWNHINGFVFHHGRAVPEMYDTIDYNFCLQNSVFLNS
jgi:hypothetical protein